MKLVNINPRIFKKGNAKNTLATYALCMSDYNHGPYIMSDIKIMPDNLNGKYLVEGTVFADYLNNEYRYHETAKRIWVPDVKRVNIKIISKEHILRNLMLGDPVTFMSIDKATSTNRYIKKSGRVCQIINGIATAFILEPDKIIHSLLPSDFGFCRS